MSVLKVNQHTIKNILNFFRVQKNIHRSYQECGGKESVKDLLFKQISCCDRPSNKKVTVVGAGQVGTACTACIFMRANQMTLAYHNQMIPTTYTWFPLCDNHIPLSHGQEVCIETYSNFFSMQYCMPCGKNQNICDKIVLMDKNKDKLCGEMYDFQHGTSLMKLAKVTCCGDYTKTKDSDVIVITAGAAQQKGQSRLDLTEINCKLFKEIIPPLAKQSPDAVLLIVSNPIDILSYAAWKYSGFPPNRIISTGTELDSSRFRFLISQKLGIAPTSVHGWIIGEHGDSSVPIWSSVNVAGVRLSELNPKMGTKDDPENWRDIHKQVVKCGGMVQSLKNYTNWAVAVTAASITEDVLMNNFNVHAVSTCAKVTRYIFKHTGVPEGSVKTSPDFHGISSDIFFSLPCVLSADGVKSVVLQNLSCEELKLLCKSACTLEEVRSTIKF